jgi:hypothetical protein
MERRWTPLSKSRVESCLAIGPPRGQLRETEGTWRWRFCGKRVNYSISAVDFKLRLSLSHDTGGGHQEVRLQHTTPNYGGIRWWFLCPKCSRRVSRLYKPSSSYCFFCRHCHNLTYESTQLSGTQAAKLDKALAEETQTTTREVRTWDRLHANPSAVVEVKRPAMNKVRDRRTGFALLLTKQARCQDLTW